MSSIVTQVLAFADPRPPYLRGEADGLAGKPGPAFPKGDATWADKLYNRGWEAGIAKRAALDAEVRSASAALASRGGEDCRLAYLEAVRRFRDATRAQS